MRRLIIIVITLAILTSVAWFAYQRSGPTSSRPASFKALDPLVQEKIDAELARHRWFARSADAWRRLGEVYEANNLLGEAAQAYNTALAMQPDDPRTLHRLACVTERSGDLDAAVSIMQRAADVDPSVLGSWTRLLWWETDLGNLDEAHAALDRAVDLDADDPMIVLGEARLLLAERKADAALARLESATSLGAHRAFAAHLRARAHRLRGDADRAAAAHAESDGMRPRFTDAWSRAMQRHQTGYAAMRLAAGRAVARGDITEARPLLDDILDHAPNDVQALNLLATCDILEGRPDEAIEVLERAIEIEPGRTTINLVSASLSLPEGELPASRRAELWALLDDAARQRPDDPKVWRLRASLAESLGNTSAMIDALERAASLEPGAIDVGLTLTSILMEVDQREQALERVQTLRRTRPNAVRVGLAEVTVLGQLGRLDEAMERLHVVEQLPDATSVDVRERIERLRAGLARAAQQGPN